MTLYRAIEFSLTRLEEPHSSSSASFLRSFTAPLAAMADEPWMGEQKYLEKFGDDNIPADSKDHLEFAAKMKAKAWNRDAEAQGRANLAALSDSERTQHMMKVSSRVLLSYVC